MKRSALTLAVALSAFYCTDASQADHRTGQLRQVVAPNRQPVDLQHKQVRQVLAPGPQSIDFPQQPVFQPQQPVIQQLVIDPSQPNSWRTFRHGWAPGS